MIPKLEKYYYIDYQDKIDPEGSFFGLAKCVRIFTHDENGKPIRPLYEFKHEDKEGRVTLSVFYEEEVMMDASP